VIETSFKAVRFEGIKEGNPRPIMTKSGRPSIETVKHYWAPCSVCGVGTWVRSKDLKRPKGQPDAIPGRPCRMTPHCDGQHRKQSEEKT
jgi:hypothetical protein